MKIYYKLKLQRLNLILGIVWLLNGIIQVTVFNSNRWLNYFWFLLALIYFALYFQQRRGKYLSIENDLIKENWLFGKSIQLSKVKTITHLSGEYILKSDDKEFRIKIPLIQNDSLLILHDKLKQLDAEWH
ncbi:hypothetical protein [Winogradskyella aurantia]|uniref:Uncharacterized protein n=1 Tax=Winogradskyella aurantia TaxID=1915063 RepID=A0A265UQG1_9FLAO|nr:hypothetical protein [Winogradskyella aurantia]OZV67533.1 hypothetical protein CA834_11315 [Winogradskyella aurantia]